MQKPDKQGKLSLIRQLLSGNIDLEALKPPQTFLIDITEDGLYHLNNGRSRAKCAMNRDQYEAWKAANVRDQDLLLEVELSAYDPNEPEPFPEPLTEPIKPKEPKKPFKAIRELFKGTSKKMEVKPQQKQITELQQPKRAGKLSEYGLSWSCDPMNIERELYREPMGYQRSVIV
ncbi:MAG: hypothetical protein M9898_06300 [Chitinophagaceae bacterium]|nr:hypothetical protein [Chitinophagaceae bacterium]